MLDFEIFLHKHLKLIEMFDIPVSLIYLFELSVIGIEFLELHLQEINDNHYLCSKELQLFRNLGHLINLFHITELMGLSEVILKLL
jgi:hypothetical protein